ncbi:toxin-antitoxin system, toxin component [Streptomyces sp. CAI-85]|uniref:toxin-antitoxin system, toxin component n=1 Tax=Streptomyces sp. CAI-85 TaxID=1472662 RepID=UPI00158797D2|nr:toxin-antitoxin system, toxin component [Streptomyces sp. CAI-85]NUV61581.1 toxin-antitoxin system, toxin component [Streptomyces sp. CAI-85]
MNTRPKAMRKLSAQLVGKIRPSAEQEEEDVVLSIGKALSQVRGRPVRLRTAAFPPATASGLWVDRAGHDLIVYEENTDPEHQLVIIGHEAWHMFQGHGSTGAGHAPAASRAERVDRADRNENAHALAELVALVSEAADTDLSPDAHTDAALHIAARADAREIDEEVEAERFGFRFATDVQTVLAETRAAVDPRNLAGRIHASMAHRFRRV